MGVPKRRPPKQVWMMMWGDGRLGGCTFDTHEEAEKWCAEMRREFREEGRRTDYPLAVGPYSLIQALCGSYAGPKYTRRKK